MASEHQHGSGGVFPGALAGAAHGDGDDGAVHTHVATVPFYIGIFSALILLTILTVRVSYYDFGAGNAVIAVLIATAKASLVAAFFMHLRHDKLFNTLSFLCAFLFLAIFILLTYDDLGTRGTAPGSYTGLVDARTGENAPGGAPATTATANEIEQEGPKDVPPAAGGRDEKP